MTKCPISECKKNKCKTKDRLLEAATAMFAEKGYFNTSINDICKEAEANISAVNYHFRDKVGLYEAVFLKVLSKFQADLSNILAKKDISTPEEILKEYISYHLKVGFTDKEQVVFNKLRLRHMVDAQNIGLNVSLQQKIRELSAQVHQIIKLFLGENVDEMELHLLHYTLISQCLMPGINPYFKGYTIEVAGSPDKALAIFTEHIFNVFINAVDHYKQGREV